MYAVLMTDDHCSWIPKRKEDTHGHAETLAVMTNLLRRRRFLRWGWRCVGFGKTHWQPRRARPETADPHSWWGKDWRHAQHLHIHTKSGNAFITGANFLFCRVKTSPFRSIRNWWRIICAGRTVDPPLRHQNHWCASLLCWMEDGDARGRKKERKKGSTLHTRGSGLLNARLNLNSEHVKAFRGFARESKGERPRDGRRRGKKMDKTQDRWRVTLTYARQNNECESEASVGVKYLSYVCRMR